jgi:hypothetical protein
MGIAGCSPPLLQSGSGPKMGNAKGGKRPQGLSKPRRGYHRAVTTDVAAEICRRIASGRTLLAVCGDADMPHHDAIYDEMARSPSFAEAIARARAESAHGLAMSVVEIADKAVADPQNKPHWAQLVKNQCDQRRWLAGKYNALYTDKLAVTDSDGGSIVERLARMSAEQRLAWATDVAAQARRLLEAPTIDHDDR